MERKKPFQLANTNNTLLDHKSPVHQEAVFPGGDNIQQTYIATYRLNRPRSRFSVKQFNVYPNITRNLIVAL